MTTCEIELEDSYRLHRRFDRMGRLVGDVGMQTLFNAHVMVIGVGGVGSFAAEALARSGVGRITLVDFDKICITNTNRQIHTMKGQIGKNKVMVMADRLRLINPSLEVDEFPLFYNMDSSDQILDLNPDWVIDAIDNITAKCHLLASCVARDIKVLCSTGAAARMDPTRIKTADLSATTVDPLARAVRTKSAARFSRIDPRVNFASTAKPQYVRQMTGSTRCHTRSNRYPRSNPSAHRGRNGIVSA